MKYQVIVTFVHRDDSAEYFTTNSRLFDCHSKADKFVRAVHAVKSYDDIFSNPFIAQQILADYYKEWVETDVSTDTWEQHIAKTYLRDKETFWSRNAEVYDVDIIYYDGGKRWRTRIDKKEIFERAKKNQYVIDIYEISQEDGEDVKVHLSSFEYNSIYSFLLNLRRKIEIYREHYCIVIDTFFYDDNGDLWEIEVHDEELS